MAGTMRCGKWTKVKIEIDPERPFTVLNRVCPDQTEASVIQFGPGEAWTASVKLPPGEHPNHLMLAYSDEGLTEREARARVDAFLRRRRRRSPRRK